MEMHAFHFVLGPAEPPKGTLACPVISPISRGRKYSSSSPKPEDGATSCGQNKDVSRRETVKTSENYSQRS